MGTRLISRRIFQRNVTAGGDSVMGGVWLPGGTVVNSVRGRISLSASTERLLAQAVGYGIEGWILPVSDPDSVATMEAMWDALVPKDTMLSALDLDTAAADANPFYEPGATVWEKILDVGLRPRRIFHRHEIMTVSTNAMFIRQDVETPFTEHWFPKAVVNVDLNLRMRVNGPSLIVFACAAPDFAETNSTTPIAGLTEPEWLQIKFIDHVVERAMMSLLGLTEAGATTPWAEAVALLRTHLDPQILEADAGAFQGASWFTVGELVFDHTVVGSMDPKILTGGR